MSLDLGKAPQGLYLWNKLSTRTRTFSEELGGLLRLHHGLVALCRAVPEEGCRDVALLHVHNCLCHCTVARHCNLAKGQRGV